MRRKNTRRCRRRSLCSGVESLFSLAIMYFSAQPAEVFLQLQQPIGTGLCVHCRYHLKMSKCLKWILASILPIYALRISFGCLPALSSSYCMDTDRIWLPCVFMCVRHTSHSLFRYQNVCCHLSYLPSVYFWCFIPYFHSEEHIKIEKKSNLQIQTTFCHRFVRIMFDRV